MSKSIIRVIRNRESLLLVCVLMQSVLTILQTVLTDAFGFSEERANNFRVMAVATTMLPVIMLSFKKNVASYLSWYIPFFVFLILTILRFPENQAFAIGEAFKFTVPLVIPTIVFISNLSSVAKFEDYLYKISWMQFGIMLYYVFCIFSGKVIITGYNMSLSYALLLPALSLFVHEGIMSKVASIILFVIMLSLGSRTPIVVFLIYVFIDIILKNRKSIVWLIAFVAFGSTALIALTSFLESFGITSRFLFLLESEEGVFGHTSGRDEIYDFWLRVIGDNLLMGTGLFCDRTPKTPFCHNVFLEVFSNYGIVLGGFLFVWLLLSIKKAIVLSDEHNRLIIIRYVIACFMPLFVSGSYLSNVNSALAMGLLILCNRQNRAQKASRKI